MAEKLADEQVLSLEEVVVSHVLDRSKLLGI